VTDKTQGDIIRTRSCYDVIGHYGEENFFQIESRHPAVGVFNGKPSNYYNCYDWYVKSNMYSWDLVWPDADYNEGNAALNALANTNPSRPAVDIPVFLFELKDLPDMVKHAGDRLKRLIALTKGKGKRYTGHLAAEDWLQLSFGWAPLIGDLGRMIDFIGGVDKRLDELNRLYSDCGLKRNYTAFDISLDDQPGPRSLYVNSLYQTGARVRVHFRSHVHRWTSVRWKPTTKPPWTTDQEQLDYTRRLVFGLNDISVSSIWEAIPWSWLADWFGSCGDYLAAHRNTVPAEPVTCSLMQRAEILPTSFEWLNNPLGGAFSLITEGEGLYCKKWRHPQPSWLPPSASLPFLNGKQLSILSAIAVTRIR
jgi:hypothetical protein